MIEIGNYLKEERQRRGMSLEEIRDITKIRIKYLTDIENGFFDEIPGEVYVKGFLRSYAEALGLDSATLLTRYHELHEERLGLATAGEASRGVFRETGKIADEKTSRTSATSVKPKKSISELSAEISRKLPPYTLWVVLIIVIALGLSVTVYKAVFNQTDDNNDKRNTDAVSAVSDAKGNTKGKRDSYYLGVEVVTEGVNRSWIRVIGDGEKLFEGIVKKDEKRTWKAGTKLEITYADAGGIRVYKNGESLGRAGANGKFITVIYQADKPLKEIPVDEKTRELPSRAENLSNNANHRPEPVQSDIVQVKRIEPQSNMAAVKKTAEPTDDKDVEQDSVTTVSSGTTTDEAPPVNTAADVSSPVSNTAPASEESSPVSGDQANADEIPLP